MYPLPDVLVLDLKMPRMDGIAFLVWRKDTPAFSTLPVMIFPGLEDKEEIERALALGASHFFAKPHNLEGYKEVVRAVWEVGIKSSATEGNQARRRSEGCPRRDGWGKAPPATVFPLWGRDPIGGFARTG